MHSQQNILQYASLAVRALTRQEADNIHYVWSANKSQWDVFIRPEEMFLAAFDTLMPDALTFRSKEIFKILKVVPGSIEYGVSLLFRMNFG